MVEQIDVKCSSCNKPCHEKVIKAHEKHYHPHCFSCATPECHKDLVIVGYVSVNGSLYCIEDYYKMKGIGVKCAGCTKFVEGEAISAVGCVFHPTCFRCYTCRKVFPEGNEICYDGEDFFCLRCNMVPKKIIGIPNGNNESVKDDLTLGRPWLHVRRGVPPPGNLTIPGSRQQTKQASEPVAGNHNGDTKVIENECPLSPLSLSNIKPLTLSPSSQLSSPFLSPPSPLSPSYTNSLSPPHPSSSPLSPSSSLSPSYNKPSSSLSPSSPPNTNPPVKCAGCGKNIKTGQALLALDKQWHLWCFTCVKCDALLTGGYMGRNGVPFCEKDYQTEYGVKCSGCRACITGKVLQAGVKHYHPNCSRCAKCGGMFGAGEDMYLNGDAISHPHCSEEHPPDLEETGDEAGVTSQNQSLISKSTVPSAHEQMPACVDANVENNPLPLNVNVVPYGKTDAYRSIKPPGFRTVQPPVAVNETVTSKLESSDDDSVAPPVPPPPTRSSCSQWRHKYATIGRTSSTQKSMIDNTSLSPKSTNDGTSLSAKSTTDHTSSIQKSTIDRTPQTPKTDNDRFNRALSYGPDSTNSPEVNGKEELDNIDPSTIPNSLNRPKSGTFPYQKGIGYNQLQQRIKSPKSPLKLPTNIDPDRLRQFLDDPEHNVYLEDHEFVQLFKMTRERFYSLPQSRKEELKSGILCFSRKNTRFSFHKKLVTTE